MLTIFESISTKAPPLIIIPQIVWLEFQNSVVYVDRCICRSAVGWHSDNFMLKSRSNFMGSVQESVIELTDLSLIQIHNALQFNVISFKSKYPSESANSCTALCSPGFNTIFLSV